MAFFELLLVLLPEVTYLSPGFDYMNKTLVVVPTYNERENLPPLAQRLLALPVPVDLLVVDDNSPDGTGKLADELAAKHPVDSRPAPHGKERAGPGLHRGLQVGAGARLRVCLRVGRRLLAQPGRHPDVSRSRPECRPGARLAVSERHPHHQLAAEPADAEQERGEVRADHHRHADHRPDGRLQVLQPAGAGGHQPGSRSTPTATASRSR